jgi:hypothetical protein
MRSIIHSFITRQKFRLGIGSKMKNIVLCRFAGRLI